MKAEERHELQQNDLKSWLQYGFPLWLKNNGSYVVLVLALCLLGYQLWNWYEKKQIAQAQMAWAELAATDAPNVENKAVKLQSIIDTYDSRPIKALALRALGNSYLDNVAAGVNIGDSATATVTVDKADALNRAQAAFQRILTEYPEQSLAVGSAKIGLAVIAENRGEWDSAKKQYEAILDKSSPFSTGAFADAAAKRLAQIDKLKTAPKLDVAATAPATAPGRSMSPMSLEPFTNPPAKPAAVTTQGTSGAAPQTAPSPDAARSPASGTQPAK